MIIRAYVIELPWLMYAEHMLQCINRDPDGLNNTKTEPVNAVTVNLSVKHRWDSQKDCKTETTEQLNDTKLITGLRC